MTVTLIAAADRRRPSRVLSPICPRCGNDDAVTAVNRTAAFVYFRCEGCRKLLPAVPIITSGRVLVDHEAD